MNVRKPGLLFYLVKYALVVWFFALIPLAIRFNFTGRGNWATYILAGVGAFALSFVELYILNRFPKRARWWFAVYFVLLTLNFTVFFLLMSRFFFTALVVIAAAILVRFLPIFSVPTVRVKTTYRDAQGREHVKEEYVDADTEGMARYMARKELEESGTASHIIQQKTE